MQNNINTHNSFVERNLEWILVAEQLAEATRAMKLYENKQEELKEKLEELSEGVNSKGAGYLFFQVNRKGSIDYTAIPGIKCLDLEQFRKPEINYWKFEREL
jgi:hypothetical protein